MSFGSVKLMNKAGKIHHLGIDESVLAPKVILTPDPLEIPFYAALLEDCRQVGDHREYVTYTGTYKGQPMSVMSCGFGCMPMAIAVEELHHLGVEEIIKIDFCPAIGEELEPNAICAALGAVRGEFASREYVDTSYPAAADMELLSRLIKGGLKRTALFRSHDLLSLETPATEAGRKKLAMWAELGVEVIDRETSAMLVIASILKVKAASLAMISENYTTGRKAEQGEDSRKALFEAAAKALTMA